MFLVEYKFSDFIHWVSIRLMSIGKHLFCICLVSICIASMRFIKLLYLHLKILFSKI
jgi:hypothetical protein